LFFNNLIIVPKSCIPDVLFRNHDIPLAGHMGINRIPKLVNRNFYWKHWHNDVRNYVMSCPTCQQMKHSTKPKNTFLTPIPIKKCPWQSIEIDFLTDLYSSKFKNTCSIMVVCDRLIKMTHFCSINWYSYSWLCHSRSYGICFLYPWISKRNYHRPSVKMWLFPITL